MSSGTYPKLCANAAKSRDMEGCPLPLFFLLLFNWEKYIDLS